jgi:uncharacterized protein
MARAPIVLLLAALMFAVPPIHTGLGWSQTAGGGDQFLDGIGETALVARYVFNGNAEDRSRNNLHAALHGNGAVYVQDPRFGQNVLQLTGQGGFVQLPGRAAGGEDALSVTGWLSLGSTAPGQRFFDFGRAEGGGVGARVTGSGPAAEFRAYIASGAGAAVETNAASVPVNRWVHLAAVLDPASRTLTGYVNGAPVVRAANVEVSASQLFGSAAGDANRLYIGRGQSDTEPTLNARVRDVRIYRIALTAAQVAAIRSNALAGLPGGGPGRTSTPPPALESVLLTAVPLESVPDIEAETIVGHLPRLPNTIPAVYQGRAKGTDVRVVWPAPNDNSQALQPGTYIVTGKVPGTLFQPKAVVTVKAASKVPPGPTRRIEPFPLGQVVLNRDTRDRDTPFIKNRDKFLRGLAATDPNRFLYNFRDAFGQKQPEGVKPLGGWDSQTTRLRGHATGHYLSAIAQAYASSTYDEALRAEFLRKMDLLIDTLYDLSRKSGRPAQAGGPSNADPAAVPPGPGRLGYDSNLRAEAIRTDYWNWGRGFISAYPPDQFIMLEKGATYGTQDSQIWAPYYTLHKLLAGLLDCYEFGGNGKALEIAKDMAGWVHARLKLLPTETRISMWNRYIAGEYGGMNEVLARLSRLTGETSILETARLFDNISVFFGNADHDHGLARNVDTIRGKHANQHIPQVIGALERYRGTRELPYYRIADNFWHMMTAGYMYSIGGVAGARNPNNAECFTAEPDTLYENGFSAGGQCETCATYNLLKLDRQLFLFDPEAAYMDHYERGLYNHILASVAESDPGNTYHVPLNPGARKQFDNADMGDFSCCNGTALESHTKLQDSIYFRSDDQRTLYVNLFVPSTLSWSERKTVVRQRTDFPCADSTRLEIGGGGRFDIKVRVPGWAVRGFFVAINGRSQAVRAVPGTYLTLSRDWRDKDVIEIRMPLGFSLESVVDRPNLASLFYGPILLAAEESGPRTDWRPVVLDIGDIGRSVSGDPGTLRFKVGDAVLKPFYETYGRYSAYLAVTLK